MKLRRFEWFGRGGRMHYERRVEKLLKGKPGGGREKGKISIMVEYGGEFDLRNTRVNS
jgi:hypothetical protein